eukprot:scaffold13779_cov121-Isochrysis_galbana.AAC.1
MSEASLPKTPSRKQALRSSDEKLKPAGARSLARMHLHRRRRVARRAISSCMASWSDQVSGGAKVGLKGEGAPTITRYEVELHL